MPRASATKPAAKPAAVQFTDEADTDVETGEDFLAGIEQVEAPPVVKRTGGGRTLSQRSVAIIDHLVENSGKWFRIGTFKTSASSSGAWLAADIKFSHTETDPVEGDRQYDRYAIHVPGYSAEREASRLAKQAQREEREAGEAVPEAEAE